MSMNHTGPPPSSTNTPSPLTFMLQYPSPTFSNIRPLALHTSNISRTRLLETLATPCTRNKHTPRTCNTHTTHPINELLAHYRSPLIVFIDGSYIDPQVPSFPISVQPSMVLVPRYATSAIVVVVNNTAASPSWTTLSTIPLFVRVQLLPHTHQQQCWTLSTDPRPRKHSSPHTRDHNIWFSCCPQSLINTSLWRLDTASPYTYRLTQH